jgi:hypothetical protein
LAPQSASSAPATLFGDRAILAPEETVLDTILHPRAGTLF